MMMFKRSKTALMRVAPSLLLLLSLTACASRPAAHECDRPTLGGDTWAHVAILAREAIAAIDDCNARNGH